MIGDWLPALPVALLLAVTSPVPAGDGDANLRAPRTLELKTDEGIVDVTIPASPILMDNGTICLIIGETANVLFQREGNRLKPVHVVKEITDAANTVALELFESKGKEDGSTLRMLKISNPFDKGLKYKCLTSSYGEKGFRRRNNWVCPPGESGYEIYEDLIIEMRLSDFELVDPSQADEN